MRIIIGKIHISITWFGESNTKRARRWTRKARRKGLCRQCSKKITEVNERTGHLYAKCQRCRRLESENQKRRLKAKQSGKSDVNKYLK